MTCIYIKVVEYSFDNAELFTICISKKLSKLFNIYAWTINYYSQHKDQQAQYQLLHLRQNPQIIQTEILLVLMVSPVVQ